MFQGPKGKHHIETGTLLSVYVCVCPNETHNTAHCFSDLAILAASTFQKLLLAAETMKKGNRLALHKVSG